MENIKSRLKRCWNNEFKEALPITYKLKEAFHDNWIRIYNFPDERRYPENQKEENDALKANLDILDGIIKHEEKCFLILGEYSKKINFSNEFNRHYVDKYSLEKFQTINLKDKFPDEYDDGYLILGVNEITWGKDDIREILIDSSTDKIRNTCIILQQQPTLIAPYDGGLDIITKDELTWKKLKTISSGIKN